MGINPVDQISKLMSHPELTERLKEPQILSAFMDISETPENISKYDEPTQEVRGSGQALIMCEQACTFRSRWNYYHRWAHHSEAQAHIS